MTDAARSHIDVSPSRSARGSVRRNDFRAGRGDRGPSWTILGIAFAVLLLILGLDFVRFSQGVADNSSPQDIRAEGIVALTGGTARIDGALTLLADGRAKRLLISGVNPAVGRRDIASAVGGSSRTALEGSVDLGHAARNTIGNADETRSWVKKHGFRSLIVVTSDYHMPRSMVELAGAMPDVQLIAYPVTNPQLEMSRWWRHAASVKLLLAEYVKYTLARARLALQSPRDGG